MPDLLLHFHALESKTSFMAKAPNVNLNIQGFAELVALIW